MNFREKINLKETLDSELGPFKGVLFLNRDGILIDSIGEVNEDFIDVAAAMAATLYGAGDKFMNAVDLPTNEDQEVDMITIQKAMSRGYISVSGDIVVAAATLNAPDSACLTTMTNICNDLSK